MVKNALIVIGGLVLGAILGFLIVANFFINKNDSSIVNPLGAKKEVIGFLPYWLLQNASPDYSKYVTQLSYFSLRVESDGSIQKLLNPTENEPGWYALVSGKADPFFASATKNHVKLSLTIATGDTKTIQGLVSDPENHANKLLSDLKPLVDKYNFSDVNIDVEYIHTASESARQNFTKFISTIKQGLDENTSLTVEISPTDAIKSDLIDPKAIARIADYVVLMAYDYHSTSSYVTGPVAPIGGAGIESEYDVTTAVEKSLDAVPPGKLILGIPVYGYEWETLNQSPRSAIIPNTGVVASNKRAEATLVDSSTESATLDNSAREKFITTYNSDLGDYDTIFFPDVDSTRAKVALADQFELGGIAVWALGYEGGSILSPLSVYIGK